MTINCIECGDPMDIPVTADDYLAWIRGDKLIQQAMPSLTLNQREALISGLCPACFEIATAIPEES